MEEARQHPYGCCSECGVPIYKVKKYERGVDNRIRETCGAECEKARKTRLQRERRAARRAAQLERAITRAKGKKRR